MVQVATGGGTSTEQLPMVFKLPKLADPYKVCGSSFTVLGFGDLVMPGFLVAFCLTFDYKRRMFDVLLKGSLKGKVMVRVYENPSSESSSTSKPTEDASESSSSSSSSSYSNGNGNNDHQSYQMQNTTQEQEEQQQSQREQHQVVFKSGELLDESITLAKTHPHVLQPNWIIHFVACISAYFVGIIITYIVLVLSESAQPALLYLVPCTLGCTIGLGWWKGELVLLWRGICYVQEEVNEIGSELIHQEPENGLSELDIQDDRDDTRLLAK